MLRFLLIHNVELPVVAVDALSLYKHHAAITSTAHSILPLTIPLERLFKEMGKGPVHLVFGVAVNKKRLARRGRACQGWATAGLDLLVPIVSASGGVYTSQKVAAYIKSARVQYSYLCLFFKKAPRTRRKLTQY
jgi:hypothetical protein